MFHFAPSIYILSNSTGRFHLCAFIESQTFSFLSYLTHNSVMNCKKGIWNIEPFCCVKNSRCSIWVEQVKLSVVKRNKWKSRIYELVIFWLDGFSWFPSEIQITRRSNQVHGGSERSIWNANSWTIWFQSEKNIWIHCLPFAQKHWDNIIHRVMPTWSQPIC